MKLTFFLLLLIIAAGSCDNGEKQRAITLKESELSIKEQELLAREQQLQQKEQELRSREIRLDSTMADTSFTLHPEIVGKWNVKMDCVETDCPGSAIGDTKTEQWEISYQGRSVIAKALEKGVVTRVYTGNYGGDVLKLMSQAYEKDPAKVTVMHISLQPAAEGRLEGIREIDRPDNCHIVYNLQLAKQ